MIENIITIIYMSIAVLAMILCFVSLIKVEFTYRNHMIISAAIHRYSTRLINEGRYDISTFPVKYEDMEDFDDTKKRLWDWGYTRILPPEKFELIKPYIKPYKESENA